MPPWFAVLQCRIPAHSRRSDQAMLRLQRTAEKSVGYQFAARMTKVSYRKIEPTPVGPLRAGTCRPHANHVRHLRPSSRKNSANATVKLL